MKDFSLGIVKYNEGYGPVIEKVGGCLYIFTNLGPYDNNEAPTRLALVIGEYGEVMERKIEKHHAFKGTFPYWKILGRPRQDDLASAYETLGYAYNGAYGRIDPEMKVFLTKIRDQILA